MARVPALVGDREDENRLLVSPVDDPVRKSTNQHSSMRETGRGARVGVLTNRRDGLLDFDRECLPLMPSSA
jgi:hypothetical protein